LRTSRNTQSWLRTSTSTPRSGALGCRCQPRPWQTRIRSPVSLRVLARRWVSRWRLRLPCGRVAAAAPGTWAFSFAASMSIDLCHRAWAISVERVYLHTRGWVESAAGELLGVQTFHKSGEACELLRSYAAVLMPAATLREVPAEIGLEPFEPNGDGRSSIDLYGRSRWNDLASAYNPAFGMIEGDLHASDDRGGGGDMQPVLDRALVITIQGLLRDLPRTIDEAVATKICPRRGCDVGDWQRRPEAEAERTAREAAQAEDDEHRERFWGGITSLRGGFAWPAAAAALSGPQSMPGVAWRPRGRDEHGDEDRSEVRLVEVLVRSPMGRLVTNRFGGSRPLLHVVLVFRLVPTEGDDDVDPCDPPELRDL